MQGDKTLQLIPPRLKLDQTQMVRKAAGKHHRNSQGYQDQRAKSLDPIHACHPLGLA